MIEDCPEGGEKDSAKISKAAARSFHIVSPDRAYLANMYFQGFSLMAETLMEMRVRFRLNFWDKGTMRARTKEGMTDTGGVPLLATLMRMVGGDFVLIEVWNRSFFFFSRNLGY